jgi:hypothetical protein
MLQTLLRSGFLETGGQTTCDCDLQPVRTFVECLIWLGSYDLGELGAFGVIPFGGQVTETPLTVTPLEQRDHRGLHPEVVEVRVTQDCEEGPELLEIALVRCCDNLLTQVTVGADKPAVDAGRALDPRRTDELVVRAVEVRVSLR